MRCDRRKIIYFYSLVSKFFPDHVQTMHARRKLADFTSRRRRTCPSTTTSESPRLTGMHCTFTPHAPHLLAPLRRLALHARLLLTLWCTVLASLRYTRHTFSHRCTPTRHFPASLLSLSLPQAARSLAGMTAPWMAMTQWHGGKSSDAKKNTVTDVSGPNDGC